MVSAGAVYEKLKAARADPEDVPVVAGPGVYALFGREADCLLPEIVLPEDVLLYIGESGDLYERDHFVAQHGSGGARSTSGSNASPPNKRNKEKSSARDKCRCSGSRRFRLVDRGDSAR